MIPVAFQSGRILRNLNVAAVGLALSSVVGSVLGALLLRLSGRDGLTYVLGLTLPTLLVGSVWARLLRWTKAIGTTRVGWILSVPLAMLNAGISCAIVMGSENDAPSQLFAFMLGATVGIVVWGPALLATLIFFGIPIARAQKLAQRGLAGEEKGERYVGEASFAMSSVGLLLSFASSAPSGDLWASEWMVLRVLAGLGLLTSAAAILSARAREGRRRHFVDEVEAGRVANYRVDASDEGKVLIRVVSHGEGYRVADFHEEIFELEASGEAKRAVLAPGNLRNRS